MPLPTSLNQYQFSFNGFSFGGTGSVYQIESVDGLEGLPSIRTQDDNRGYNDGMFSGQDFYGGRNISMVVLTFAGGGNSAQTNFNLLQQNVIPQTTGTTSLQFQLSTTSDGLQVIYGRVRARKATIDPEYTFGFIRAQIEFFCPDPTYFDNTLQSAVLAVSPALGRTYNRIYNLVYGGGSIVSSTSVVNAGWATTYPTITANGPITNPIFGNATTGYYLSFTGTYTNTDSLVIDLYNKLITLNGVSARNLLASGNWFSAPAGTSLFYMTGTGTIPLTTSATVTWRNAYI